jgi:hypothetical protein
MLNPIQIYLLKRSNSLNKAFKMFPKVKLEESMSLKLIKRNKAQPKREEQRLKINKRKLHLLKK